MKKTLGMMGLFMFLSALIFLIFQYNQKATVQLSIQETLEQSVETVMNTNLDSSYRVYETGNSLVDPGKFEEELKETFATTGTINTRNFENDFEFKYLIIRDTVQIVVTKEEYLPTDEVKAVRIKADLSGTEYLVTFVLDIRN